MPPQPWNLLQAKHLAQTKTSQLQQGLSSLPPCTSSAAAAVQRTPWHLGRAQHPQVPSPNFPWSAKHPWQTCAASILPWRPANHTSPTSPITSQQQAYVLLFPSACPPSWFCILTPNHHLSEPVLRATAVQHISHGLPPPYTRLYICCCCCLAGLTWFALRRNHSA